MTGQWCADQLSKSYTSYFLLAWRVLLLNTSQCGFRSDMSTRHELVDLINGISQGRAVGCPGRCGY